MAESGTATVLRRKAEQSRAAPAAPRGTPVPARALRDAFRRASEEELKLSVSTGEVRERHATAAELVEGLPEQAFLGILLGPEEGVGLFCLDPSALAAVVEVRTMGRVGRQVPPPRRTTRADAALVADLIDRILAEFEAPLLECDDARWVSGWRFQMFLADPRPLGVVLEEGTYRVLETEVTFGDGDRQGRVVIALPATGRAQPRPPSGPPPESAAARAADAWTRAMDEAVATAEARLDVVLGRLSLSLGELAGLATGDRILLPISALGGVRLMAPGGAAVGEGRLGQSGGVRAVRIADPGAPVSPAKAEGTILPAGALYSSRSPSMAESPLDEFAPAGSTRPARPLPSGFPGGEDVSMGDLPDLGLPDLGLPATGLPDIDLPGPQTGMPGLPELSSDDALPDLGDFAAAPMGDLPPLDDPPGA